MAVGLLWPICDQERGPIGIWEWWVKQLRNVGQKEFDNPNGAQFIRADTLATAPAPKYICVSPIGSHCTPGVKITRNTTSGALSWTTDFQNGVKPVTEASAALIAAIAGVGLYPLAPPSVADAYTQMTNNAVASKWQTRIGIIEATLINGALADVSLVPAVANFYGVLEILGVMMPVAPVGAILNLDFESEDNVNLYGSAGGAFALTMVANIINKSLENMMMYPTAVVSTPPGVDGKACEVDLDTGGGAGDNGKKVVIHYRYHYET